MFRANVLLAVLLAGLAALAGAQSNSPPSGSQATSPADKSGSPRRGPPPEAIAACKGKASGAACTFVDRENAKLTGTRFAPPPHPTGKAPGQMDAKPTDGQGGLPLACRPTRGAPGGESGKRGG